MLTLIVRRDGQGFCAATDTIRTIREKRKLSQSAFAVLLGVTQKAVSLWETGSASLYKKSFLCNWGLGESCLASRTDASAFVLLFATARTKHMIFASDL